MIHFIAVCIFVCLFTFLSIPAIHLGFVGNGKQGTTIASLRSASEETAASEDEGTIESDAAALGAIEPAAGEDVREDPNTLMNAAPFRGVDPALENEASGTPEATLVP